MAAGLGLGAVPEPERPRQVARRHGLSVDRARPAPRDVPARSSAKGALRGLGRTRRDSISNRLQHLASFSLVGRRAPSYVHARVAAPAASRRTARCDGSSASPLHRDGVDLERHREGRPRPRGHPRRLRRRLFQLSRLAWLLLTVLPGWLGLDTQGFEVGIWETARTVLIFLGIPLTAGFLTRRVGLEAQGARVVRPRVPRVGPDHALRPALHDACSYLRSRRTRRLAAARRRADRAAAPRVLRRHVGRGFVIGKLIGLPATPSAAPSLPGRLERLRLAIAVAVGVFGATSGQALAGVVAAVEVPVLVSLVYVALWARRFWAVPGPHVRNLQTTVSTAAFPEKHVGRDNAHVSGGFGERESRRRPGPIPRRSPAAARPPGARPRGDRGAAGAGGDGDPRVPRLGRDRRRAGRSIAASVSRTCAPA